VRRRFDRTGFAEFSSFPGSTIRSGGTGCTGKNCPSTGLIVGSVLGGLFGLIAIIFASICIYHRCRGRPAQPNLVFVKEASSKTETLEKDPFQTGLWSSVYYQYGTAHGPHSLSLSFDRGMLKVTGQGTDDVGRFIIGGTFSVETHRMGLTKTYQRGTGNTLENFGHTVTLQLMWNSSNNLFDGKWFVQAPSYSGEGKFELRFQSALGVSMERTKY
jgi:hypothetical protein